MMAMLMVCLLVVSTGCSKPDNGKKDDKKTTIVDNKKDDQKKDDQKKEDNKKDTNDQQNVVVDDDSNANDVEEDTTEVTLYIGFTGDEARYQNVQATVSKPVTDEKLIALLAKETNWDLRLGNPIMPDHGGRVIEFSSDSMFTSGPDGTMGPGKNEQKREYFCYDSFTLVDLVLGSIQKTLDVNLMSPGRSLALYFSVEGKPIRVENKEIPADLPWYEMYHTWNK